MPRETLEPLPLESSELIGISADRCYCLPSGAICAPCLEREPGAQIAQAQAASVETELDNAFAQEVLLAEENREASFNEQVAVKVREVTLKIVP
jgi:hypothetical protein